MFAIMDDVTGVLLSLLDAWDVMSRVKSSSPRLTSMLVLISFVYLAQSVGYHNTEYNESSLIATRRKLKTGQNIGKICIPRIRDDDVRR